MTVTETPEQNAARDDEQLVETEVIGHRLPRYPGEPLFRREIHKLKDPHRLKKVHTKVVKQVEAPVKEAKMPDRELIEALRRLKEAAQTALETSGMIRGRETLTAAVEIADAALAHAGAATNAAPTETMTQHSQSVKRAGYNPSPTPEDIQKDKGDALAKAVQAALRDLNTPGHLGGLSAVGGSNMIAHRLRKALEEYDSALAKNIWG